jgi:hypothetical protein
MNNNVQNTVDLHIRNTHLLDQLEAEIVAMEERGDSQVELRRKYWNIIRNAHSRSSKCIQDLRRLVP